MWWYANDTSIYVRQTIPLLPHANLYKSCSNTMEPICILTLRMIWGDELTFCHLQDSTCTLFIPIFMTINKLLTMIPSLIFNIFCPHISTLPPHFCLSVNPDLNEKLQICRCSISSCRIKKMIMRKLITKMVLSTYTRWSSLGFLGCSWRAVTVMAQSDWSFTHF